MKSNITLISLNSGIKKEIALNLANTLGMFYIDINDFINYQLLNVNEVITKAGLEYYNKEETKIVASIASYENVLITLNLETFFNKNNYKKLKETSLFIYLKVNFETYKRNLDNELPQKTTSEKNLNKKVFFERDKLIEKVSEIVIDVNNNKDVINSIINSIKNYYKGVL